MVKKCIHEEKNIHILGRNSQKDGALTLFHAGCGIEMDISAKELWVEFLSDYSKIEPWISIEINGCAVSRMMITKGVQRVCIFRNMSADIKRHIRIIRDVQAMGGDDCFLQILGIEHDGEIYSPEEKAMKIEFIGDSITSGEGAVGAVCETEWVPVFFSVSNNYAIKTANMLNADFRIFSQSGWGVLSSWDNNPNCAVPDYYESVCSINNGDRNISLGALEKHDFNTWQPDFVVVNLGTNDSSAFNQEPWRDEETGEEFKQKMTSDGEYDKNDIERFENKAISFLRMIRKHNPKAKIIWAFGMIETNFEKYIINAVERYKNESSDENVVFLPLPKTTEETVGARNHPGVKNHEQAAQVIRDFILMSVK